MSQQNLQDFLFQQRAALKHGLISGAAGIPDLLSGGLYPGGGLGPTAVYSPHTFQMSQIYGSMAHNEMLRQQAALLQGVTQGHHLSFAAE